LLAHLGLESFDLADAAAVRTFAFRVTRSYANRMRRGDLHDPLLLQVLPAREELFGVPGFTADPVGDRRAAVVPGVLHKYHGRALLLTTGACAINCRYCFRRSFPYGDFQLGRQAEAEALDYLAADPSMGEVILSGGDPLVLSDMRLSALVAKLAAIPHLQTLRVHTRLPVVLPSRVTVGLVEALSAHRLMPVMVIHANHPNEVDRGVLAALQQLRDSGFMLLNQAVLLRGINDDAEVLASLNRRLALAGVLPYYLHQLDRASGTGHFLVSDECARGIHEALRRRLPGYLVPRLARETAGEPYKTLL
jgi:EF-P beta-lysylation protein EpmB